MLNWTNAYGILWVISFRAKAGSTRDGTCPVQINAMLPYSPFHSCAFRDKPVHKGDKVVPPASFPAALPADSSMIPDEPPTVSDEVLEEVCHNPTSSDTLLISVLKLHAILVLVYAPS